MPKPIDCKPAPNEILVETLERLLAEAKDGELQTAFIGCGYWPELVNSAWAIGTGCSTRRLIGEIEIAKQEMVARLQAQDESSVFSDFEIKQ